MKCIGSFKGIGRKADKKPKVNLAHNMGGIRGMIVTSVIVVGL